MHRVRPRPQWFTSFGDVPGATRSVVCFPHAGGASSTFRTWHRHASSVSVAAVALPGRESRLGERPATEMGHLIPLLAEAIRPVTAVPYALFGHSMGALLAFELAEKTDDEDERRAPEKCEDAEA